MVKASWAAAEATWVAATWAMLVMTVMEPCGPFAHVIELFAFWPAKVIPSCQIGRQFFNQRQ